MLAEADARLLLRAIFDGALEAMLLVDDAGRFTEANPAACALFGLSKADLVGQTLSAFLAPPSQATGRLSILRADGSTRIVDHSAVADIAPGLQLAVFRDVTERVAAEDALRRNEAQFRAIIHKSSEIISLTAADGTTRYLTESAWHILGWTQEELGDRKLRDLVVPEDRVRIATELAQLIETGARDMAMEFRVQHRDGSIRWIESTGTNLLDDPNVRAVVGNYRDITARKDAEAALQLSEQRFRLLVEELPEPVLVHVKGKIVYANAASAQVFGVPSPAALIGHSVIEFATPNTRAIIEARMARALSDRETLELAEQSFLRQSDGQETYAEVRSISIVYDGQPAVLSVARDVTRRVLAEHERERLFTSLEFERRRLAVLLEQAPALIGVLRGKDHVFDFANAAYSTFAGGRALIGKPLRDALPEVRDQGFIELLDAIVRDGTPWVGKAVPTRIIGKSGQLEQHYIDVSCQPFCEADGTRSGVFMHGVDVTDATILQQRVRAQFHGVPVPTYVWQRVQRDGLQQFVLVDFNKAALDLSSALADRVGETATSYFADAPAVIGELTRCLDGGATLQHEMDWQEPGSDKRRLFVTYASAPPDLVIVHTEDVTARIKLEHQFRQAQKMEAVGRLAGGVAHDFNNLLSVILSYSTMAFDDLKEADPLRDDMEAIMKAGQRATELTRQLLAFSRQQILQPRVVNLNRILSGMTAMLARLLGEDIRLTTVPELDIGNVLADPGQIEQVVMNLAVNARDAMPDGGNLTIETSNVDLDAGYASHNFGVKPGRYVLMAVSDNGLGMDAATRSRIFEPFFTTKEVGKGTGLGLSTVFGIVQQSGGHIGVYSEPGLGCSFKVYLPRTEGVAEPLVVPTRSAELRGAETILLVEDEPQVRAVACAILRRAGYHVIETSNGGEAFLVSKEFGATIHLLLTDVVMPGMNGRKLAEELALQRPKMKVLFASGYTDDAIVHHGVLDAGAAFIQKPFTPETLLRKVREVLES